MSAAAQRPGTADPAVQKFDANFWRKFLRNFCQNFSLKVLVPGIPRGEATWM